MKKKDLLSASKQELLELAADLGITGRWSMNKAELAGAIVKMQKPRKASETTRATKTGRTTKATGKKPGGRTPRKLSKVKAKPMRASAGRTGRGRAGARRVSARKKGPIREGTLVRRSWREQQAVVQHAKYETKMAPAGKSTTVTTVEPQELPTSYEEDRIVLLVRDPYWVHAYWEITRETLLKARAKLGEDWHNARSVLRIYDITDIEFDGKNANSFFDVEVSGGSDNWYINTRVPNRTYCVDIGLVSPDGTFIMLARSNRATTPRDVPSEATDEEWMIPDWEFDKIYALSGGFTVGSGSIELKEMMEKALGGETSSGAPGSFAMSSPAGKAKTRGFWFRLGTELIVYGATEADARVTLQGRPIKLRPDGTFTVRFELPDGKQVIPAVAESADGAERITITPTVDKKTKK
jgi:hypothetical protein